MMYRPNAVDELLCELLGPRQGALVFNSRQFDSTERYSARIDSDGGDDF
jgi:hypothetical protein